MCPAGTPRWASQTRHHNKISTRYLIENLQVSFFRSWIDCVISTALETGGVRAQVEERCNKVAESLVPDCLDTNDLMFDLDSLNTIDDSFPIPRCDQ